MPPAATTAAADEAIELAESVGLILDDWQRDDLRAFMGERPDGRWQAFECVENCPRQNGKNVLLEVRELYGLFVAEEELLLHSSHEFKTTREAFRRLLGWVEGSRDLSRKVAKVLANNNETSIELTTGQRIKFIARRSATGRGFTADFIAFDEAFALAAEAVGAVLPTLSSRPNPQVWYTSSAGFATSDHFRALRQRGLAGGDPHLAYLEWSAPDEAVRTPGDRDWWYLANPSLGIRIPEEHVERELATLPADQFARERLGIWSDEVAVRVIPHAVWAAVCAADVELSGRVVFGVEADPERSVAAIVAVDGDRNVEVVEQRPGVDWVDERVVELAGRYGALVAVDPKGPAGNLLTVPVEPVSGDEMAQACADFYDAVGAGRLRVSPRGRDVLDAAVAAAGRRPVGDRFVWDRRSSVPVVSLIAATVALRVASRPVEVPSFRDLADYLNEEGA